MARSLRFQYPGAMYHIMARGDGGKMVFETDDIRWGQSAHHHKN
jgi:putative transposase